MDFVKKSAKKSFTWLKKNKKWAFGGAALLLLTFWLFSPNEEIEIYTGEAVLTDIDQIVYVTGTVESDLVVDLKFKQSGTVEKVYVKEGDRVEEGDYLLALDNDELEINVARAKANLDMAMADLNLEYAGPQYQDISISQAEIKEAEVNLANAKTKLENTTLLNEEEIKSAELEVKNAEITLEDAQKNYDNTVSSGATDLDISNQALEDAYEDSKADIIDALDVVSESLFIADEFLGIDNRMEEQDYEEILQNTASVNDKVNLKNGYKDSSEFYDAAYEIYDSIKFDWEDSSDEIENLLELTENSLLEAKTVLDLLYKTVEEADPYGSITQSNLDSLATSYASKQDLLTAAINSIQSVQQDIYNAKLGLDSTGISSTSGSDSAYAKLQAAENDLEIAESALSELELTNEIEISELEMEIMVYEVQLEQEQASYSKLVASPRDVDVASLIARVAGEQADYDQALNELEDSILKAPADGVVTKINLDEGENVSALTDDVATMMADKLRITTNISETDISKVSVGDNVSITFDAFSSDRDFTGEVVSIDPAETIVQGVIYYEAKIDFDPDGEEVKSGMTANLEILTESAEDVIAISPQALNYEDGEIFIFVMEGENRIRRTVKVGLQGDEMVEILEGLEAGEEVLIYENKK